MLPTLERQKKKIDQEFKASLGYISEFEASLAYSK